VRPFKPFKYKMPAKTQERDLNRLVGAGAIEELTGIVQGQKASAIEERFAKALTNAGLGFVFQFEVEAPTTIPGQENVIDFIVDRQWPTEIDGLISHKTAADKAQDQVRDAILNDVLSEDGYQPIQRIPGYELETQQQAETAVRERFYA
jgi:hypothetical protein